MPTLVDSLVVSLSLNSQQFQQAAKLAQTTVTQVAGAITTSGKQIESATQKAADSVSKVTRQIMALYAVLLGSRSIKDFVIQITQSDAALGHFATQLGSTPQAISAVALAVQRLGGSADAVQSSFQNFSDQIQQLRLTGEAAFLPWMNRLAALTGRQFNLNKATAESFDDVLDAIHDLAKARGAAEASYVGRQMGLDPGSINLAIENSNAQRRRMEKEAGALGPKPEDVAAAQKLQAAWVSLQQTAISFGRTILTQITPAMTGLLKEFTAWIGTSEGKQFLNDIVDTLKEFVAYLRALPWGEIRQGLKDFGATAVAIFTQLIGLAIKFFNALPGDPKTKASIILGIAGATLAAPTIANLAGTGLGIVGGIYGLGKMGAGLIGRAAKGLGSIFGTGAAAEEGAAVAGAAEAGTGAAAGGLFGRWASRLLPFLGGPLGMAAGIYFGSTSPTAGAPGAPPDDLDKWIREHPGQIPPGGDPNAKPAGSMVGAPPGTPLPPGLKGPTVITPVPESTTMSTGLIDVLQKEILQFMSLKDSIDTLNEIMKKLTQVLATLVNALTGDTTGTDATSGTSAASASTSSSGTVRSKLRGATSSTSGASFDPNFKVAGAPPATSATVNARAANLMGRMMRDFGLTREQAAGAVGWMMYESAGLNPNIVRKGGTDTGYAQWVGSRRAGLYAMAGVPLGEASRLTAEDNYRWLSYELTHNYAFALRKLKEAKSYQEAVWNWGFYYQGGNAPQIGGMKVQYPKHLPFGTRAYGITPQGMPDVKKPEHQSFLHMLGRTRYAGDTFHGPVDNSATTHINNLVVHSAAPDAGGIVADLREKLMRTALITHAQSGPA